MTVRERNLLVIFLGIAGVFGGLLVFHSWFYAPLQEYNQTITQLGLDVEQKQNEVLAVQMEKKRQQKLRVRSLPASPDQASAEYAKWLYPALQKSGLREITLQPPAAASLKPLPAAQQGKKHGHLVLAYNVRARADLASVVRALRAIKEAPILHRVKSLSVAPTDQAGRVNVQMTLEAMIVNKAGATQPFLSDPADDVRLIALETAAGLRGAPLGWAAAPFRVAQIAIKAQVKEEQLARNYEAIAGKNVFIGAIEIFEEEYDPGLDMREFVHLTHLDPTNKEAFLRNRLTGPGEIRLRAIPRSGYDTFRIMDEEFERVQVHGKVLRIDQRDLYFQVSDFVYAFHIGQTLKEAMRWPLSLDQMDTLELTALFDDSFAEVSAVPASKKGGPAKGKGMPTKGGGNPQKGGKKGFGGFGGFMPKTR
jgi:hypothetical protein